jgi:hypothetical protein
MSDSTTADPPPADPQPAPQQASAPTTDPPPADPPPAPPQASAPTTDPPPATPLLTDDQHTWTSTFLGIDTRGTNSGGTNGATAPGQVDPTVAGLPVMAAMGAPSLAPLPGPEAEGPVSGVVRKAGQLVVEGASAVATGAEILAVGIGAAILTWSSKTAPPWMDEMNPETGQPYKSEDEWKAVKERRRQRGAQPAQPPAPNIDPLDPEKPPAPPSCANTFPGIESCADAGGGYPSMDAAARAQPEYPQVSKSNVTTMGEYSGLPGGANGHATYYDATGKKLFTLIKRPCCADTDAGPVLNWRWVVA